jgi:hypothetical protein
VEEGQVADRRGGLKEEVREEFLLESQDLNGEILPFCSLIRKVRKTGILVSSSLRKICRFSFVTLFVTFRRRWRARVGRGARR